MAQMLLWLARLGITDEVSVLLLRTFFLLIKRMLVRCPCLSEINLASGTPDRNEYPKEDHRSADVCIGLLRAVWMSPHNRRRLLRFGANRS